MALGNISIVDNGGLQTCPVRRYHTEAAATTINAGEPVKLKAAGSGYVIPLADAEPVIGTTTAVVGIASTTSTHTASADGFVDVYVPREGVVYRAKAKTAADIDTAAELLAKTNDRVIFDLTSGVYTVDTGAADGATNGITIVGGNITEGTVDFIIRGSGTLLD